MKACPAAVPALTSAYASCVRRTHPLPSEMRKRLVAVVEHEERLDKGRPKGQRLFKPNTDYMVGTLKAVGDLLAHVDKGCLSDYGSVAETFMPLDKPGTFGLQQWRRFGTTSANESLHKYLNVLLGGRTTLGIKLLQALISFRVSLHRMSKLSVLSICERLP